MNISSSVASNVDMAQQYLEFTNRVISEGQITADAIVAQSQAETLVEVEAAVLEQAVEIEKMQGQQIIDLLA